jgi:hypothetical protein
MIQALAWRLVWYTPAYIMVIYNVSGIILPKCNRHHYMTMSQCSRCVSDMQQHMRKWHSAADAQVTFSTRCVSDIQHMHFSRVGDSSAKSHLKRRHSAADAQVIFCRYISQELVIQVPKTHWKEKCFVLVNNTTSKRIRAKEIWLTQLASHDRLPILGFLIASHIQQGNCHMDTKWG